MGENKNSDFKIKSLSLENSHSVLSGLNPQPSSYSSHGQESNEDHKLPRKRPHSLNNDLDSHNNLNKRKTSPEMKNGGNAAQQIARASMSQQQMTLAMPKQITNQQSFPNQTHGYNETEMYRMDPIQGAKASNSDSSKMSVKSRFPLSCAMPAALSSVASTSETGISNYIERISLANESISTTPCINMANDDRSLDEIERNVPCMPISSPSAVVGNQDKIINMLSNSKPLIVNHAVLTPPPRGQKHSHIPKPPGCRTVFVSNVPEKITEEIIGEVFEICGPIYDVHISKKKMCLIKFVNMESVDQALLLSGFQIRIDEQEDPAFNGILHVDYAIDCDDQHNYECHERETLNKEHYSHIEGFCQSSLCPIPLFSKQLAESLDARLRDEKSFSQVLQVLLTWIDRGECNKINFRSFYSLVQSCYNFVRKLRNRISKRKLSQAKISAFHSKINELKKVFVAVTRSEILYNFTENQSNRIKEMKRVVCDSKEANLENSVVSGVEEEIKFSIAADRNDNEDSVVLQEDAPEKLNILQEKLNSLTKDLDTADQSIENFKAICTEQHNEMARLRFELEASNKRAKSSIDLPGGFGDQLFITNSTTQYSPNRVDTTENEIKLITMVAIFLQVHPLGASIDYICAYLMTNVGAFDPRHVESLLRRYSSVFEEVCTGIGATLERKWIYIGFK